MRAPEQSGLPPTPLPCPYTGPHSHTLRGAEKEAERGLFKAGQRGDPRTSKRSRGTPACVVPRLLGWPWTRWEEASLGVEAQALTRTA